MPRDEQRLGDAEIRRRREVGNRQCAGINARGHRCGARAAWTMSDASPYCAHHEYHGPAPCIGGGPLDGCWIDRGTQGYNFQLDEIAVGRAPDGSTWFLAHPACNYGSSPVVVGRYRFGYRETDLAPRWFWEPLRST